MSKVVRAVSLSLVVASASVAWSQEIGTVTAMPNAVSRELVVDTAVRPAGDTVYIVRGDQLITDAVIKSSSSLDGTVLTLPTGSVTRVEVGDAIHLQPPAGTAVSASTQTTQVTTEVGAPEPVAPAASAALAVPVSVPAVAHGEVEVTTEQLDKTGATYRRTTVETAMAAPTPRGMGVPVFPAPAAVSTEAGIMAPYGQGLAAAAPVGTPYLRSPAFAGPPIIYMPQTVTRVLLPGATPYPSNIMSPPTAYAYASAPFLRTDIYTSMPYGTFYWPQGYAGTTPVEPQVPAYVTAPASAILSTEADYAAGRYDPAVATAETLNPITAGINANLLGSTGLTATNTGIAASVSATAVQPAASLTIAQPGLEANPSTEVAVQAPALAGTPALVNPFPVLSDGTASVSVTDTTAVTSPSPVAALPDLAAVAVEPTPDATLSAPALPSLPAVQPTPDGAAGALPTLPNATPAAGLPTLPEATPAAGLPTLPDQNTDVAAAALPGLPAATPPAGMQPSLPQPAAGQPQPSEIIIDDSTPGAVTLTPADGWTPSASTEGYNGGSQTALVDPAQVKTAVFNATIPADGLYEIAIAFVGSPQFRSNAVPVSINTATGPQQATLDQTQTVEWHVLGNYQLKQGDNVPVVSLTTQGLEGAGSNVSVSVDAVRLRPVQ